MVGARLSRAAARLRPGRTRSALGGAALVAAILGGCLERTEEWTITDDGGVRAHLEFETKSFDELYAGDAVPTIEAGWVVVESVEKDEEGRETFRLVADAEFAPDADLPGTFAGPRDADADVVLAFPTTLEIEARRDGLYYHFHRRYRARPWAFLEGARALLKKQLDAFDGVDPETMPPAQRAAVIRAFARFETMKDEAFARTAFRAALPDAAQDAWLDIAAALAATVTTLDVERLLPLFLDEESATSRRAREEEEEALAEARLAAMVRTLRATDGVTEGDVNAFVRAFRREQRFFELTEDLGDDAFSISVTMPGHVIGHNGDALDGTRVSWRFSGEQLRDRDTELMVTSRGEW